MSRTPTQHRQRTPTLRTPTRSRTPGTPRTPRPALSPTPARRRRLSSVSEISPPGSPSSPTEITFITLPPPTPDRRSPRPNPLRNRKSSVPLSTPRKRQRTTTPTASTPSRASFVPSAQPPLSNLRSDQPVAFPPDAGRQTERLGQGIPIPAPIAAHPDFRQFLSDLEPEVQAGIEANVISTPVSEAVVDAMWEACTFLRDTAPGLKAIATGLLREVLNHAA